MAALTTFYEQEKQRFIDQCRTCSLCAEKYPILSKTELKDISPKEIQRAVETYLAEGCESDIVRTRVFSCMECFGCNVYY